MTFWGSWTCRVWIGSRSSGTRWVEWWHTCSRSSESAGRSTEQVRHVRRLVEGTGNSFTYRAFPAMPHSMHGHDPATFVTTVVKWLADLS